MGNGEIIGRSCNISVDFDHCLSFYFEKLPVVSGKSQKSTDVKFSLFEICKIVICFPWLSLPGHYRVPDEALLAKTT